MYKSKLHELCQKRAWELPKYDVSRHGLTPHPLFQATVFVNGSTFKSQEFSRSSKEAQNDVARVAFLHVTNVSGNLTTNFNSAGSMSNSNNTLQLQNPNNGGGKDMRHLYKNMLQNFTQKKEWQLPVYSCECDGPPHARRFKCKVIVNGETFESSESFSTVKDAEHAAAKVALTALSPDGLGEDDSCFYKNLLQELAQKRACQMPVYTTAMSGEPHNPLFVSSVSVAGRTFEGQHSRTKKQAEISAAKVAFTTLNGFLTACSLPLPTPNQNSTASMPASQVTEMPGPSGLHSTANADPQQNARPQVSVLHNSRLISSDHAVAFRGNEGFDSRQLHSFPQPGMAGWSTSVPCSSPMEVPLPPGVTQSSVCPAPYSLATINSCNTAADSGMSCNQVIVYPRASNMTQPPGSTMLAISDDNYVAVKHVPSANQ